MASEARQRLSDDHQAVGDLLTQVLTALDNRDVQASYSKLDLLWARLAVHIRAEHLHLFPTVIRRCTESSTGSPALREAQAVIEGLRTDHNFFMRELARAVTILRELPHERNSAERELSSVLAAVREVEKRLATHNQLEEEQIYRWAAEVLTEPEQVQLATAITSELENRPPRFSLQSWVNP